MRIRMLPFLFIGFMLLILAILLFTAAVHANPAVVIAPNGQVTVIYQGTQTSPTVVLPPSGQPTFVYPGTAPVPITVTPYTPYVMPALPLAMPPMVIP